MYNAWPFKAVSCLAHLFFQNKVLSGFIPNNAGLIIMVHTCTRVHRHMHLQGGEGGVNCMSFLHLTFKEKTGGRDVDLEPELLVIIPKKKNLTKATDSKWQQVS